MGQGCGEGCVAGNVFCVEVQRADGREVAGGHLQGGDDEGVEVVDLEGAVVEG